MISQIPPKHSKGPTQPARVGPVRRASDLVRHHDQRVELRGFEPLTPSMRTECATSQTGQIAAFAQFSGLRKDTIIASEAA